MALARILLERGTILRHVATGFLAGLAAVADLPAGGVMAAGLAAWLACKNRGAALAFLAGATAPLMLHAALQMSVTGSPLPAEMTPHVFEYPGSYWLTEAGRWREQGPRWRFGLELVFGPQGWLTVTPAVGFGLIALTWIATRRGDPLRPAALVVGLGAVVLLAYYTWGVRRTDFAGQSFGTRHLLPITPAVYAFGVIGLGRLKRRLAWGLFAVALAVGLVYSVAGQEDPWGRIERRTDPPIRAVQRLVIYPWSSYAR
jgi:hypothetical protein